MKYDKKTNTIVYTTNVGISSTYKIKNYSITDAAMAIGAGTTHTLFVWDGVDYDGMTWLTSSSNGGIDKPTESELNAKVLEMNKSDALKLLRVERNQKLVDTDWVVLRSNETGVAVSNSWKTYRQALRDLPETQSPNLTNTGYLDYTSFTWPTKPS